MREKISKFGGAMFTPVLFFAAIGIIVAICTILRNPMIVGSIANEGTTWSNVWTIVQNGAWTIFNYLELLFVVCIPLGLAKKAQGKAAAESLVIYLIFINLVSNILQIYGPFFGIDFASETTTGLKMVAGIQTLDMGIVGAILIASIVSWLHNRYFDKRLPSFLGTFQGSTFITITGFFLMIPTAILVCLIWPHVQNAIYSVQGFMSSSGVVGVAVYTFLNRFLIPTGLHHFIWQPIVLGPALVDGGLHPYYLTHMQEFAASTQPLIDIFPEGGFGVGSNLMLFAPIGVGLAFYVTAKPENKKKTLALVLPVVLTATISGITEPFEFLFLFAAPLLWLVYSLMGALMAVIMYLLGVVTWGGSLIDMVSLTWIPMFSNHSGMIVRQIIIGLIFTALYFFIFRFLILKFNYATPGRETISEASLQSSEHTATLAEPQFREKAKGYLHALGGSDNIESINNCATRLRVSVKDDKKVLDDTAFKEWGAMGVVRHGKDRKSVV